MSLKISINQKKLIDTFYNHYITRNIGKYSFKIMPPLDYIPKKIQVIYDNEYDILKIILEESSQTTRNICQDNIKIDLNENNIIDTAEISSFMMSEKEDLKKEINECISKINSENAETLKIDLNDRTLSLIKKILMVLKTDNNFYNAIAQIK